MVMWTWEEDKKFEIGLAEFPEDTPGRWEKIAAILQSKSVAEVKSHYAVLMKDIAAIQAGLVELPPYPDMEVGVLLPEKKATVFQRRTAVSWSKEEHRRFLVGLERYGRGDWKSISRQVVHTRNPTQVASHAQKYFERQERKAETKKRRSIFDRSVDEINFSKKHN